MAAPKRNTEKSDSAPRKPSYLCAPKLFHEQIRSAQMTYHTWKVLVLLTVIAMLVDHILPALADSSSKQILANQQMHPSMSCYVCSTMDYDNPNNNLCRNMNKHRPAVGIQHQHSNLVSVGHYPASMSNYPSSKVASQASDSSPISTTSPLMSSPNSAPSKRDLNSPASDRSEDLSSVSQTYPDQQTSSSQHHQYNAPQGHPQEGPLGNASTQVSSTTMVPVDHGHYPHGQHRVPPPTNYIRMRPCMDDENFCSIVSVVRIEFANDNIFSRFWALERNCSKSCNRGCMLIGERVRLRVCSQCCRTPNCNSESGASSTYSVNLRHLIILSLATFAANIMLARRFRY